MTDRILLLLGIFAFIGSGFAIPGRVKRMTGPGSRPNSDVSVTEDEKNALFRKFTQDPVVLELVDIPKLMYLKNKDELPEDIKSKLPQAILDLDTDDSKKNSTRRKLSERKWPSLDEEPFAWAMSVTSGMFTPGELKIYQELRLARRPPQTLTQLSGNALTTLTNKLKNNESLTTDEITQLTTAVKESTEVSQLVNYIFQRSTPQQREAILQKRQNSTERVKMSMHERNILWAMAKLKMVPDDDVLSEKVRKAAANATRMALTDDEIAELKAALVDVSTPLNEDDIEKLQDLKVLNLLTPQEKEILALKVAESLDDEEIAHTLLCILREDCLPEEKERIKGLMKAGVFDNETLDELAQNGFMLNGELISDAISGPSLFSGELGLTNTEQTALKQMGSDLTDADFTKVKTKEKAKKLANAFQTSSPYLKETLIDITTAVPTPGDIEAMQVFLPLYPAKILEDLFDRLDGGTQRTLCRVAIHMKKLTVKCESIFADISSELEDADLLQLEEELLSENGLPVVITDDSLLDKFLQILPSLSVKTLKLISPEKYLENQQLTDLAVKNGERDTVMEQIQKHKNLSSLTATDMLAIAGVPLRPDELDEIPADAFRDSMPAIMENRRDDNTNDALTTNTRYAKKYRASLPSNIEESLPDQLVTLLAVGGIEWDTDSIPDTTTESMLEKAKDMNLKIQGEDEKRFAERATQVVKYRDATALGALEVEELAFVMGQIPETYFSQIGDDAIRTNLDGGKLKNVTNFDTSKARKLGNLLSGEQTPADVTTKMNAGILKGIDAEDLDRVFPEATVCDVDVLSIILEEFDEWMVPNRQVLVKKISSGGCGVPICTLGKIVSDLPDSVVKGWPDSVVTEIVAARGNCDLGPNLQLLAILAEKMINWFGEPTTDNGNYTSEAWTALYILVPGMSLDQIKKLPVDSKIPSLVKKVLRLVNKVSEAKREALIALLDAYFGSNKPTTVDEIAAYGPKMQDLDEAELSTFPGELCSEVVDQLNELGTDVIPRSNLEDKARFIRKCLTGATSGAITVDKVAGFREYICHLATAVSDLTPDAGAAMSDIIGNCPHYDPASRAPYKDKMMVVAGGSFSSLDDVGFILILPFLVDFTKTELDQIPAALKSKNMEAAAQNFEARKMKINERARNLGEGDAGALETGFDSAFRTLIDARIGGGATRRKRSTNSLDCITIKSAGQMAKAFTLAELSSMTDTVVLDCLAALGAVLEWSPEQKALLAGRLKTPTIHGTDLSTWTSAKIQDSGSMLEGLNLQELGQLVWTTNLLGLHGTRTGWTMEQLTAVISKWLQTVKSDNAATITAEELNTIGHFICGLTMAQINAIPSAAYQSAVVKVGQAVGCTKEKAQAFAVKAKAIYGAVNTWSVANVIAVNNVLAGLSSTELSSLNGTHLAEIRPETIPLIPPSTLSGLTDVQIRGLSKAQAWAVTEEQYKAFNPSQRTALLLAGGKVYIIIKASAAINKMSVISTILVILVTIFLK